MATVIPNQNGTTPVTVRATDPAGAWVENTFDVVIAPVSDDPIATEDHKDATEDVPLVFPATDLLTNDVDVDRTGRTVDATPPSHFLGFLAACRLTTDFDDAMVTGRKF